MKYSLGSQRGLEGSAYPNPAQPFSWGRRRALYLSLHWPVFTDSFLGDGKGTYSVVASGGHNACQVDKLDQPWHFPSCLPCVTCCLNRWNYRLRGPARSRLTLCPGPGPTWALLWLQMSTGKPGFSFFSLSEEFSSDTKILHKTIKDLQWDLMFIYQELSINLKNDHNSPNHKFK